MRDHKDFGSMIKEHQRRKRKGRIIAGFFLIAAGAILLAKKLGTSIPDWVFSWEVLLIAIGFIIGASCSFRNFFWLVPVAIGGIFLVDEIYPETPLKTFIWPALIIIAGIFLILKPRRKKHPWGNCCSGSDSLETAQDKIDYNTVFGTLKKTIISKNFQGGEINCVFSGTEINLSQADIQGKITLDLNLVFCGARIIVPSNWTVHTEIDTVLGGVEDKRMALAEQADPNKILVLKGAVVFGGVEISNR